MTELNFKIIFVPKWNLKDFEHEWLLREVKSAVERCGLCVTSINFCKVKQTESEQHPEIEELSLEIVARNLTDFRPKSIQYNDLCLKWKLLWSSLPCSYLEFYDKDYFINPDISYHRINYSSIAFGTLPHNGYFHQYAILNSIDSEEINFYHDTRSVEIKYGTYCLCFSYDNIRNIFIDIDPYPFKIYFDLCNPPIIFRVSEDYRDFGRRHRNLNMSMPDALSNNHIQPLIDTDTIGRSNVICVSAMNSKKISAIIASIHYACSEKSVYYSIITVCPKYKPSDPVIELTNFDCAYLITAMIRRNFIMSSQTPNIYGSLTNLHKLSLDDSQALEKALTSVLSALDSGKIVNYWHCIESQFDYYKKNKDEISFRDYIIPPKCRMIRRVVLTPTRLLLWPAEIMLGNRILRHFDSEYSLRVSFREDNVSSLSFNAAFADPGVLDACIENPMTSGICIGSRKYEFLAWSNSQIRDHGVWMYAIDDKGETAGSIRQWMGDFSHIHNVPKYMARMGQCFSQTEDTLWIPLDEKYVKIVDDIEGGYDIANSKPYCFSDGIGKISVGLSKQVLAALGHDQKCSAMQTRYAGSKGMLTKDPTLRDQNIVLRKSMIKFDCPNSTRLEIARTSKPSSLQLNRPFITLLNGLGVRHRVFLRLQENMLKTLTDMLFDEAEAVKYLNSRTSSLYNFEALSNSGIHLTTEPFFKSVLLALHRHHIEKIKKKANIDIDPSKGRNMLGVLDETAILCYGQVFVQYTKDILAGETGTDTEILKGVVLVTKNPCMYPGDVRKFEAVDIPQLHHIVDCIVFPQTGHRPHPNEMAGSDLDGDEYSVLWSPELIFHGPNRTPGNFPAFSAPDVDIITVSHMIDFLQEYIKNDQVGSIANAHLAQADNMGISSPVCLRLAEKFSIAVDFAKNGQTVVLHPNERPKWSPDFMEKPRGAVYESEKALGKMYRECKDFESENQERSISYNDIKVDQDLVYDGWELYKDDAIKARNKYISLFSSVLRNYGIQHEAEVFSGAFTNLHCRFQERKDRHEIEKVIVSCVIKLNKCMFQEFLEEFQSSGRVDYMEKRMFQKASAWYIVTYSDPGAKILSFPWCVSKVLVNIKLRKTLGRKLPFSPAIMRLDNTIMECESKNLLPYITSTRIGPEYNAVCDPLLITQALRTLIQWAQDQEVLERPGKTKGLLFESTFINLFFHVAEIVGYVKKKSSFSTSLERNFSPGQLCIEFFKFCSALCFYADFEMEELLPFPIHKNMCRELARRAITSYHNFALSGSLETLNFDRQIAEALIIMKPIHINSMIFRSRPVSQDKLRKAERILMKYSEVHQISLREIRQNGRVCVSARGSKEALKKLKNILDEGHHNLQFLFSTGTIDARRFKY